MTSVEPVDQTYFDDPDDETDDELPNRPARRRLAPLTMTLIAGLLAAAGFVGGVQVEKRSTHAGATPTGFPGTSGAASAGSRTPASGAAPSGSTSGVGPAGGGATVGTVKLVDGATVYVSEADGTIIKVTTSPKSAVTTTSTGTAASLKVGDTVAVTSTGGTAGAGGTINAASISDLGTGTTPGGLGLAPGGSGLPAGAPAGMGSPPGAFPPGG